MLQYAFYIKGWGGGGGESKPHNKTSKDFPLDSRYFKRKTEEMKPKRMS